MRVLASEPGPLLLTSHVLTETGYMLSTRVGVDAELGLLADVRNGIYTTVELKADDLEKAITVIERYRDHNIGLADAIVVTAARYRTTRILGLDERHFRMIRPLYGDAFTLLPVDG
jgi:predicted nucleic acid-binding protein